MTDSHDHSFDRQYWEDRYAAEGLAWSGDPNPVLVTEAAQLAPGRALDIGCGEGADAFWLAEQGWQVTAVDIAVNALDKAQAHAESVDPEAAARIGWQQHDLTEWSPAPQAFDLVSSQFMHLPRPTMTTLFRSLSAAVAPGGTLLIVGHDASDVDEGSEHHAHLGELMFTVEEVLAAIKDDGLQVKVAESRQREAAPPNGREFVHDVVVMASRSPA